MEIKVNQLQTENNIHSENKPVTEKQDLPKNEELFKDEINDAQSEDVELDVDVNNLGNVADSKLATSEQTIIKPGMAPKPPETKAPESEEEKKEPNKFIEFCKGVYQWTDKKVVPVVNKMVSDVKLAGEVIGIDIDENMKIDASGNTAMAYSETKQKFDGTYLKAKSEGYKKYNPEKEEETMSVKASVSGSNQLAHNLKLDTDIKTEAKVTEKGGLIPTTPTDPNSTIGQEQNINLKFDGKEVLTYTPTYGVKVFSELETHENYQNEKLNNDVKLTLGSTVQYAPTDHTKGSTTVKTSEEYKDTDLIHSSSVSTEMSYKDTLYKLSDREIILDGATKANVFYGNDYVFDSQLLKQNIGVEAGLSGHLTYNDLLYSNGKSYVTMSNVFGQSFNYKHNFDLSDNFTWSTDLNTSISTSLTFKMNDYVTFGTNANGSYTLSSGDDKYSFGGGLNANITPVPKNKDFKILMGASYSQSDKVDPSKDDMSQQVDLNASVAFDKNFGVSTAYKIHIDGKKSDEFDIAFKVNF